MSPAKVRRAIQKAREIFSLSERRACRIFSFHRSTMRYANRRDEYNERLTAEIVELASAYGRYGYRRICALLKAQGWRVNHKRIERIWRQEGLKVPAKQPKKRRLWLADGSCVRLRPLHPGHVWSYDFVADRTADGRAFRILSVIDEFSRTCLALPVARRFTTHDVIEVLADLFLEHGLPEHIRSDNGPEFTSRAVRNWLASLNVKTAFIEPGSPWENGYCESFNDKMRDEHLNGEIFDTLQEARILTERWRREYNEIRPHSSLGYRPPAPRVIMPAWPSSERLVMSSGIT